MTSHVRPLDPRLTLLALALLAAFGPAAAQTTNEGSVSVGAAVVNADKGERSFFDQYSGRNPKEGGTAVIGAELTQRDEATGASTTLRASDLAGGNREIGLRWKQPGDWKARFDYRELIHRDLNSVNTGLVGAGSATPQVVALPNGPGTGNDFDLSIKRSSVGIALTKVLSSRWQAELSLSNEDKEGSRLFGIGMNCPSVIAPGCRPTTGTEAGWAVLMLPEPINSHHSQIEARVSYAGGNLNLSAGYYGSYYRNVNSSLRPNVPASLYNPLGTTLPLSSGLQSILSQPVALPPNNEAHQWDLGGTYAFSPSTHLNFKLAYSQALQEQDFASGGFSGAPAGVTNLGGNMSTLMTQVGLSARPSPKLSLSANVHYEDRDDRTPLALYNVEDTSTYTNRQLPLTKTRGKAEAAYQFSSSTRASVAAKLEFIDRGVFTPSSAAAGTSALRQKTDETGYVAELRQRVSETFSGSLAAETGRRRGSNWLQDNSGRGVTEISNPNDPSTGFSTAIFMPTLADRNRDKVKLQVQWQPSDALSLQLIAETGRDSFDSPSFYGVHRTTMDQFSLDADYAVSEEWHLTGYAAHGRQELNQSRVGAALMAFSDTSNSLGLGVIGTPSSKVDLGLNLAYLEDRSRYAQTLDATAAAGSAALLSASGGLPDVVFRQTELKLMGKYKVDKHNAVRLDLAYQYTSWNDWAWSYNGTPFVYSDGTTLSRSPSQAASFIAITYIHQWP